MGVELLEIPHLPGAAVDGAPFLHLQQAYVLSDAPPGVAAILGSTRRRPGDRSRLRLG